MLQDRTLQLQLRALEPSDIDDLYRIENNPAFWRVSGTLVPFSKAILEQYIANAHRDIYEVKQQRFVIDVAGRCVGMIDLFDFDPYHKRAGVGVIIEQSDDRNRGYASAALGLLCSYAFAKAGLHQLYANILSDNTNSIKLFKKHGFTTVGTKKDWCYTGTDYKDETLFQLINEH